MQTLLTRRYTVGAEQADWRGYLRPSALQSMLLDAATGHSEQLGVSREDLQRDGGVIWMLSRLGFRLLRPPEYRTELTVETWYRGPEGPYLMRDFRMSAGGEAVGYASSAWVLYSRAAGRVVRPGQIGQEHREEHPPTDVTVPLSKLKAPGELTTLLRYRAAYMDLDINEHVNNVRYTELCSDALLTGRPHEYIRGWQIAYKHEVRLGQEIELLGGGPEHAVYLTGRVEGRDSFEAAAELCALPILTRIDD